MKARSCLYRRALGEKLTKLRISSERECNIRYPKVNQIPNKHRINKETIRTEALTEHSQNG